MKRVIITVIMLFVALSFIFIHRGKVNKLSRDVDSSYDYVMTAVYNDDFSLIKQELEKLKSSWKDVEAWVSMTVDSDILEDIEISLDQCLEYTNHEDKEDFIGEYIMCTHLLKHLPYFENITFKSLF